MPIKGQSMRRFLFENFNGIRYDVRLNHSGAGEAFKLVGSNSRGDDPKIGVTKVALTVDAPSLDTVRRSTLSAVPTRAASTTSPPSTAARRSTRS